jgi:hypothetical protein
VPDRVPDAVLTEALQAPVAAVGVVARAEFAFDLGHSIPGGGAGRFTNQLATHIR